MQMYAACLASYNNGRLFGTWIDLDDKSVDEIQDEISAMLRGSPYPNVLVECPSCDGAGHLSSEKEGAFAFPGACPTCQGAGKVLSAEEWAAHDYDGEGLSGFGEYPDLDKLVEHVRLYGEHGEAWLAYVSNVGEHYATEENFSDTYQGKFDSPKDWAEEFMTENLEVPEHLRFYIDYEAYARDAGSYMSFVDLHGDVYVFTNS